MCQQYLAIGPLWSSSRGAVTQVLEFLVDSDIVYAAVEGLRGTFRART